MDKLGYREEA